MSKSSAETSTEKTTGDNTAEYEVLDDGTLVVYVPAGTRFERVRVCEEGTHWCGTYYVD